MKKQNFFTCLLLSVCFVLAICFSVGEQQKVFAATTQGEGNYYYLYGDAAGRYYQLTYDRTVKGWKYNSTEPYLVVDDNSCHPGRNGAAIKAWRAPADGVLEFDVTIEHTASVGDGVVVSFGKRAITENGTYAEYTPLREDLNLCQERHTILLSSVQVKRGDMVFVSVAKGQTDSNDSTALVTDAQFEMTAEGVNYGDGIGDSRVLDVTGYFSTEKQGDNGWFYAYGEVDRYVLMTFGTVNDGTRTWRGKYAYQQIGADYMHPSDRWKTMRIFVADCDGVMSIDGSVKKNSTYGDGVRFSIYKNGEKLWSIDIEGADDKLHEIPGLTNINVKAGDVWVFALDGGANYNISSDSTGCLFELYYVSRAEETKTDKPLNSYLNAVETEGQILDVIEVEQEGDFDLINGNSSNGCNSSVSASAFALFGLAVSTLCIAKKVREKR